MTFLERVSTINRFLPAIKQDLKERILPLSCQEVGRDISPLANQQTMKDTEVEGE